MKKVTYAAVAALALGSFAGLGCDRDQTASTSSRNSDGTATTAPAVEVNVNKDKVRDMADRTGDAIHRGAEKTGDALANAADKTKEVAKDVGGKLNDAAHRTGDSASRAVDRAADRTDDAADRTADRTSTGVDSAQEAGARATTGAPDAGDTRELLAEVTRAALTKGGVDDVAERFTKSDYDRLKAGVNQNFADLDGRIDQFQKDWKAKYNQDFKPTADALFPATGLTVAQGSVQIAQTQGMPAVTVPIVHESPDRWRIDAPDTLTAEKLKQNLLDHLTAADNPAQWPDDVNQAYAQVSRHILMAVLDQPAK